MKFMLGSQFNVLALAAAMIAPALSAIAVDWVLRRPRRPDAVPPR